MSLEWYCFAILKDKGHGFNIISCPVYFNIQNTKDSTSTTYNIFVKCNLFLTKNCISNAQVFECLTQFNRFIDHIFSSIDLII